MTIFSRFSLGLVFFVTSMVLLGALPQRGEAQEVVASASVPGTLVVTFTGLRNNKGVLRVTLFDGTKDGKGYPGDIKEARLTQVVELAKVMGEGVRETTVTFSSLPAGSYAIAAYHDENNNNKMDSYWYGKPKEGIAASNNPRPKMRAPRWKEAKFDVPDAGKNISIALWYP